MPGHLINTKRKSVLFVHPSCLMFSEIYLRLEPLGLELVDEAARRAGSSVRLIYLQVNSHQDYYRVLEKWQPEAIGFSLNYLANVPEAIDMAKTTLPKASLMLNFCGGPQRFVYRL